ncbi:MAG: hypothetical protein FWD80_05840, partial [Propionibacteriaceae bacterium]|nr:hypothetical protein [Propionibacteriaceae bacterium]
MNIPTPTPQQPPSDLENIIRAALAQLTIPTNPPQIGPQPNQNQWGIIPVGYPIWLWTTDNNTLDATVTQDGITITINATKQNTTFNTGDNHTITCTK